MVKLHTAHLPSKAKASTALQLVEQDMLSLQVGLFLASAEQVWVQHSDFSFEACDAPGLLKDLATQTPAFCTD